MINPLLWLYWDPPRVAFTIPIINHPVVWYGVFFVTGLVIGYFMIARLFYRKLAAEKALGNDPETPEGKNALLQVASTLADKLIWYVVAGTLIGARLGHVFFYGWPYFRENLWEIPMIWHGGLASHGGVIGVFLAVCLYQRSVTKQLPSFSIGAILDRMAIPAAIVAGFIRLGNFWNQEILGAPTQLPWGIVFGHPADGSMPEPRHPVQLYEGILYFAVFGFLYTMWRRGGEALPRYRLIGWMFLLIFGGRFLLEYLKLPLSAYDAGALLHMGQWLSIPFVAVGVALLWASRRTGIVS